MHDKHGMALDAAHAAFDVAFNRRESATLVERTTDGLRAAIRAFLASVEPSEAMTEVSYHEPMSRADWFKAVSAKLADELDNNGE